jgi:nucleoside-diphosphate-sugar epimerase
LTSTKPKLLITGAAGRIGRVLTEAFADRYELSLTDMKLPDPTPAQPFTVADIADFVAIRPLFDGVETVIHMAANPSTRATWEQLLPGNVIGLYNVFEAAQQAGCKRVIYASSINAVNGYLPETQIQTHLPIRPTNLYGATKAWGEAVARYYADQQGLSALCLRFGWVIFKNHRDRTDQASPFLRSMVLTYRDLVKLVEACVIAPDTLRFGIFHGLSNNRWKCMDLADTRQILGYEPTDDGFDLSGVP